MAEYLYNERTGTLHIRGFCKDSKGNCPNMKPFNSEKDALAYDGRGVRMCKICEKKRASQINNQ